MRLLAAVVALGVSLGALLGGTTVDSARLPYQSASGNAFRVFTNDAWRVFGGDARAREILRVSTYEGDEPDLYVWSPKCLRTRQEIHIVRTVMLLGTPAGGGGLTFNAYGAGPNYVTSFEFLLNGRLLLRHRGSDTQQVEPLTVSDRRTFREGANELEIRAVKKPTPDGCNDGNQAHGVGVRLQVTGLYRADLTTSQRFADPLKAYQLAEPGQSVSWVLDSGGATRNRGPNLALAGTAVVEASPATPGSGLLVFGCDGDVFELRQACTFSRLAASQSKSLKIIFRTVLPASLQSAYLDFHISITVAELPGEPGTNYAYYKLDPNLNNNQSTSTLRVCVPPIKTLQECRSR